MKSSYLQTIRFILVTLIICVSALLTWPRLAQAGSELPPRQTPPPSQPDDRRDHHDRPIGAYIELHVQSDQAELWAVVQWQDSTGNWHDVEGWRGVLTTNGYQQWWVASKDFGAGPFRWVVVPNLNGSPLAISSPFKLPIQANEVLQIEVSIKQ